MQNVLLKSRCTFHFMFRQICTKSASRFLGLNVCFYYTESIRVIIYKSAWAIYKFLMVKVQKFSKTLCCYKLMCSKNDKIIYLFVCHKKTILAFNKKLYAYKNICFYALHLKYFIFDLNQL